MIEPVLRRGARTVGLQYRPYGFEKIFYLVWLIRWVDRLDQFTAARLKHRWTWNLLVLQRD